VGRLDGKAALVTGGASGLGEATVRRYVAEGAGVMIADIQAERAAALAGELGERATAVACDVSSEDDLSAAVALGAERFGRLDVVFSNAGTTDGPRGPGAFEQITRSPSTCRCTSTRSRRCCCTSTPRRTCERRAAAR
jgi:NAD(P)-dependent dehydrogenase (short-subunit alcohol dehydrogenase family)